MSGIWLAVSLLVLAGAAYWLARRRQQNLALLRNRLVAVTQSVRQTGDNIAHDLRTPLTRLRADVEAALRQEDGKVHRAALERVLALVDALAREGIDIAHIDIGGGLGILPGNGAVLGPFCLVGAGALIAEGKRFEEGGLIVGVPARLVRPLRDSEKAAIGLSAAHYAEKAARYAASLQRV